MRGPQVVKGSVPVNGRGIDWSVCYDYATDEHIAVAGDITHVADGVGMEAVCTSLAYAVAGAINKQASKPAAAPRIVKSTPPDPPALEDCKYELDQLQKKATALGFALYASSDDWDDDRQGMTEAQGHEEIERYVAAISRLETQVDRMEKRWT